MLGCGAAIVTACFKGRSSPKCGAPTTLKNLRALTALRTSRLNRSSYPSLCLSLSQIVPNNLSQINSVWDWYLFTLWQRLSLLLLFKSTSRSYKLRSKDKEYESLGWGRTEQSPTVQASASWSAGPPSSIHDRRWTMRSVDRHLRLEQPFIGLFTVKIISA